MCCFFLSLNKSLLLIDCEHICTSEIQVVTLLKFQNLLDQSLYTFSMIKLPIVNYPCKLTIHGTDLYVEDAKARYAWPTEISSKSFMVVTIFPKTSLWNQPRKSNWNLMVNLCNLFFRFASNLNKCLNAPVTVWIWDLVWPTLLEQLRYATSASLCLRSWLPPRWQNPGSAPDRYHCIFKVLSNGQDNRTDIVSVLFKQKVSL